MPALIAVALTQHASFAGGTPRLRGRFENIGSRARWFLLLGPAGPDGYGTIKRQFNKIMVHGTELVIHLSSKNQHIEATVLKNSYHRLGESFSQ